MEQVIVDGSDYSYEHRYEIISAARVLFSRKGYDHTDLEDISEQSGLALQAVMSFFRSKDDILEAVWSER